MNTVIKNCPRCHVSFECRPGDVTNCQCASVLLNQLQRNSISRQYDDCLCAGCLRQLRDEAATA